MDELNNTSDFGEYVTFTITAKDGSQVEMAVMIHHLSWDK